MPVTKDEVLKQYEELFDTLNDVRLVDLHFAKYTIAGLRNLLTEKSEMVNYLLDHPLRDFEYTVELDEQLSRLEKEAINQINRLEQQFKSLKS